jgi:glycerol-3-phosphate acyltransferase PlsX
MDNSGKIIIAVDAMGGDFAPDQIVLGALQAARDLKVGITLVGKKAEIEQALVKANISGITAGIVEASEVITDQEQPAIAVMKKRDNSLSVAIRLVKEQKAQAIVSAGPTGAIMVAGLQFLGALPGVERPTVGGSFLGLAPGTVVLDLGANVGCQPYQLVNFAVIGVAYVKTFLKVENPSIGLLNVGVEEGKGDTLSKEAYTLLRKSGLNFIGNVEGHDIVRGKVNVIVCDGFTGNVLVKFSEGLGQILSHWLGQKLKDKLSQTDKEKICNDLYGVLSPSQAMGGGPMLGINGVVCKAHGNSQAPQIAGTIQQAKMAVESGFINILRESLEKVHANVR